MLHKAKYEHSFLYSRSFGMQQQEMNDINNNR